MGKVTEAEGASVAIREEGGALGCSGMDRGRERALAGDWATGAVEERQLVLLQAFDASHCLQVDGGR